MTQNDDNQKNRVSPVTIGIVGAVAGAVGTAVAMTLSDEEKKKKAVKKFYKIREDVNKSMNKWMEKAQDLQKNTDGLNKKSENATDDIIDATEEKLENIKSE